MTELLQVIGGIQQLVIHLILELLCIKIVMVAGMPVMQMIQTQCRVLASMYIHIQDLVLNKYVLEVYLEEMLHIVVLHKETLYMLHRVVV